MEKEYRQRIVTALASLLETDTLDHLSVSDICDKAGISRQTFYRCFEDKYAIAVWYVDSMVDISCRKIGVTIGWRDGYLTHLLLMERNMAFFKAISTSRDYNSIHETMIRYSERDYTNAYRIRTGHAPDALLAFQIHAWSRTATENITEWVEDDDRPSATVFVDRLLSLVPRELHDALDIETQPGSMKPIVII